MNNSVSHWKSNPLSDLLDDGSQGVLVMIFVLFILFFFRFKRIQIFPRLHKTFLFEEVFLLTFILFWEFWYKMSWLLAIIASLHSFWSLPIKFFFKDYIPSPHYVELFWGEKELVLFFELLSIWRIKGFFYL